MTRSRISIATVTLALVSTLGVACDSKVAQCNKLIDPLNRHTQAVSTAMEKLGELEKNPTAADDLSKTIKAADDEIAALEFSNEDIKGFAGEYRKLLTEADNVGKAIVEAAKSQDEAKVNAAIDSANGIVKLEDDLVNKVNGYCQGTAEGS